MAAGVTSVRAPAAASEQLPPSLSWKLGHQAGLEMSWCDQKGADCAAALFPETRSL